MKNKILNLFKITLVLSTILLISSSCTKENNYDNWYNDTDVFVKTVEIRKGDWVWNNNLSRYEVAIPLPVGSVYYDDAVINASVFFYEGNAEMQTPLPYVRTWINNITNLTYTETLSFEASFDRSSIIFYIQSSDLGREDSVLPDWYEIKYSFIYQKPK